MLLRSLCSPTAVGRVLISSPQGLTDGKAQLTAKMTITIFMTMAIILTINMTTTVTMVINIAMTMNMIMPVPMMLSREDNKGNNSHDDSINSGYNQDSHKKNGL